MGLNLITALTTLFNKIVSLNDNKIDTSVMKNLCSTTKDLDYTVTTASNWTVKNSSVHMIGNAIRCNFSCSRSSKLSEGNITNEDVITFTIKTLGSIHGGYIISFPTGNLGQNASFSLSSMNTSGSGSSQTITFTVKINSTYAAGTNFSSYFWFGIRPNVSYYS